MALTSTGPGLAGSEEVAWSEHAVSQLLGLLSTTRAIAGGADLSSTLDEIAGAAAGVIGGRTASILLLNAQQDLELSGSFGLSADYGAFLRDPAKALRPGRGPAGLAIVSGEPIAVEDVSSDPRFDRWREVAAHEGYGAMLSVPLAVEGRQLGAITVYRSSPGPWSERDAEVLIFFAEHAASAVIIAQLAASQGRQVAALSRLVLTLRKQTHEHANRLHAIGGLLALAEYDEAKRFVAGLESAHHFSYGALTEQIGNLAVAGLLVAQISIAEQRGITVKLDRRSQLTTLPEGLGDAEVVTLLGNLLDNAMDSVSDVPTSRRRITVTLRTTRVATQFRVRDWGRGLNPEEARRVLEPGFTTKSEHFGVGLSLVAEILGAVNGAIEITPLEPGTAITVTIPRPEERN